MTTTISQKTRHTYEDYLNTPDDKRYELIDGELVMTPSPISYHQWISKNIAYEIEKFARETGAGMLFCALCACSLIMKTSCSLIYCLSLKKGLV